MGSEQDKEVKDLEQPLHEGEGLVEDPFLPCSGSGLRVRKAGKLVAWEATKYLRVFGGLPFFPCV